MIHYGFTVDLLFFCDFGNVTNPCTHPIFPPFGGAAGSLEWSGKSDGKIMQPLVMNVTLFTRERTN